MHNVMDHTSVKKTILLNYHNVETEIYVCIKQI